MTTNRLHIAIAVALLLGAAALHGYEHVFLAALPDTWSYVWSMLPYVLCLIVLALSTNAIPMIAGATVALALDGIAHYEVFVNPRGSTAALVLLFVPLWSTIIFVPIAMLIARAVVRKREARSEHAP